MREKAFQPKLIKKIKNRFEGCVVMKNNANYKQGVPDLLILYKDKWAALECKRSKNAPHRPNQDYYVNRWNKMSFASFIFPENEEDVLNAMDRSFRTKRNSRSS